jgi:hypothetical protein
MAIIFSIFEIFGEREKMANLIFRRKKRICVKNVPIHLFLLPRCENLSPKKKKKKSPKCSHFIYFCCQDVKNLAQRKTPSPAYLL